MTNEVYTFPCGCKWPIVGPPPKGSKVPLIDIPDDAELPDCPAVWDLLGRGATKGVFQLESNLGKHWSKRLKPTEIEHLSALAAILRPGTLQAKDENGISMTEKYCRRKNGEEELDEMHAKIKEILNDTYDILCVAEGCEVSMADGTSKPIEQITPGDKVCSLDVNNYVESATVIDSFKTSDSGDIYKLTLSNGWSTKLTGNHPVLTYDGYKKISDLNSDDLIATPKKLISESCEPLNQEWLGQNIDVAYLFGVLIGNGCLTSSSIAIAVGSEAKCKKTLDWINEKFPVLTARMYFNVRCWYIGLSTDVLANAPGRGNRLKRLTYLCEQYDIRKKANYKRVPKQILKSTPEVRRAFIAGYFDSDGHSSCAQNGYQTISFCSVSSGLLKDIRNMLLTDGIALRIETDGNHAGVVHQDRFIKLIGPYVQHKSFAGKPQIGSKYGLLPRSILLDDFNKTGLTYGQYTKKTGLLHGTIKRKHPHVLHSTLDKAGIPYFVGDVAWQSIRSVESCGVSRVYDITVEKNHNFVVDGIVAHNCYQEQAMRLASDIAGFDGKAVNRFRKGIAKKDVQLLASLRDEFISGCEKIGILNKEQATVLWTNIQKSGRYSFNRSHSCSYGLLGYDTAYLKAHIPQAFFTSWLTFAGDQDEVALLIADAKLFGVDILTPDIRLLNKSFDIDGTAVRFGITNVRGIGDKQYEKIVNSASKLNGDWSWERFLLVCSGDFSSTSVQNLIGVGGFHWAGKSRLRLQNEYMAWSKLTKLEQAWALTNYKISETLVELLERLAKPKNEGGGCSNKNRVSVVLSQIDLLKNPRASEKDSPMYIANQEEEILGVSLTCSKIDSCDIRDVNTTCKDYIGGKSGNIVLGVEIKECREFKTKSGKNPGSKMAFLKVEDSSCALEDVVIFPEQYITFAKYLRPNNTVILQGERDAKRGSLIVKYVWQA